MRDRLQRQTDKQTEVMYHSGHRSNGSSKRVHTSKWTDGQYQMYCLRATLSIMTMKMDIWSSIITGVVLHVTMTTLPVILSLFTYDAGQVTR